MSFYEMAGAAVVVILLGGLISAFLMRSNRRFSVNGLEEISLVAVIMVITALIFGIALTYMVGAEEWAPRMRAFYIIGLGALGLLAEDWLERQIADGNPLENQSVEKR